MRLLHDKRKDYKAGWGYTGNAICDHPPAVGYSQQLVYRRKNGISCGKFYQIPTAINILPSPSVSISIFPNPATDELNITSANKITNITISNMIGQTVYMHDYNAEQVQIDVADLPNGVYFAKINEVKVTRFVKE